MQPSDYIAIVFGTITILGGIIGYFLHKLDKLTALMEVKNQTIAAQDKTIDTQDRQILSLEATAKATNSLMGTLRFVVEGGKAP